MPNGAAGGHVAIGGVGYWRRSVAGVEGGASAGVDADAGGGGDSRWLCNLRQRRGRATLRRMQRLPRPQCCPAARRPGEADGGPLWPARWLCAATATGSDWASIGCLARPPAPPTSSGDGGDVVAVAGTNPRDGVAVAAYSSLDDNPASPAHLRPARSSCWRSARLALVGRADRLAARHPSRSPIDPGRPPGGSEQDGVASATRSGS